MKIFKNIVRPLFIAVLVLTLFTGLQAQTKKKKTRWNWEKHQVEIIDYAKKYLVSDIEPNVPKMSFADWFQQTVGKATKVEWSINDCGEQTGTSADRGRDLPMCVEAAAVLSPSQHIRVNIQFGTFKRGIMKDKPVVRSITVGEEMNSKWLDNLSDLSNLPKESVKGTADIDPTVGVFRLSGEQPSGFEKIGQIRIRTRRYIAENEVLAAESLNILQIGQINYEIREFFSDSKNFSFETRKVNDVSFAFLGELAKIKFDRAGLKSEKALSGRLAKFVNGKKTAEADVVFDFVLNSPCKGCGQPN